jgi:hypothetical protein
MRLLSLRVFSLAFSATLATCTPSVDANPTPARPGPAVSVPVAEKNSAAAPPASPSRSTRSVLDRACPSAVAGAKTRVADVDGGVELVVTADTADAAEEIRRRVDPGTIQYCQMAKEPRGWLEDDCFGEKADGGQAVPCPVMARRTDVSVTDVSGGVRVVMKPLPKLVTLDALRREVRARASTWPR